MMWNYKLKKETDASNVFEDEPDVSRTQRLIINLVGTSGSGKSTQGKLLSKKYNIPHISIGDLFRAEHRAHTPLSKIDSQFKAGYAPDELCIGMVCKRLAMDDCKNGFILDGFPRTSGQAKVYSSIFIRPTDVHMPFCLNIDEKIIKARLENRRICTRCGQQTDIAASTDGTCPIADCHGALKHRDEDIDKDKLENKFAIFRAEKDDILHYLEQVSPVHMLNLETKHPSKIFEEICSAIDIQLLPISELESAPHQTVSYR